jgi:kynurenine formamidase
MTRLLSCLAVAAAIIASACTRPAPAPPAESAPALSASTSFPAGDLVDLSHTYDSTTLFWPTAAQRWVLNKEAEGETAGGYYYSANNFSSAEHGGTHIDAPVHFARGRRSVDRIPLDSLIAPAVVVDVTEASTRDADYQITAEDLQKFEQQHGPIPRGTIVLLKTGFASRWPDARTYLGTEERGEGAVAKLHFPGLHPAAAAWLVSNRSVKAVGIDTASIDYGQSKLFETHRTLMGRDIPAFENLASLDRLPPTGAYLIALPMKIGGGSGAPLRAVAVLPVGRRASDGR